ncbi:YigZ family protein [uncultured Thermanaerothrix sp.]|uniref:IMPACT family protein n=1 Tax=uncultured Thermanaerothrix sp. TaxID=1195149 RepID=UPI00263184F4|nr:YigZ family protein [uncultured Thermanaerothrix sp.]
MLVVLEPTRCQLSVSKSRFIASLFPVHTEHEVRTTLARIRSEFPDASHHPYAYIVNHLEHSSDDGEPGSTAGRPILLALKSRQVEDVLLVVTRYFGGIKLGTAGLARAYREAALQALDLAQLGQKTRVTILHLQLPYALYNYIEKQLSDLNGHLLERQFTSEVSLTVSVAQSQVTNLLAALEAGSHGQILVQILEEGIEQIIPLTSSAQKTPKR